VAEFPAQVAPIWQATARQQAQPLKLWVMDESRFGLQTVQRRRITLPGVKPVGAYQHRFENFYLYGAVCPHTGEGDFAVARHLNRPAFARFIQQILMEQPTYHHLFLLDNSATHALPPLDFPTNVTLLFQPPYAPELNPIERVGHDAKRHLAWRNFATLFDLQAAVEQIFLAYSDDHLASLTATDYLIRAVTQPELSLSQLSLIPPLAA
jgi:transposase